MLEQCSIHLGDCLDSLRKMPDGSVNCCVTSPPYYALRDYGVEGQLGLEDSPEQYVTRLVSIFGEVRRVLRDDGTLWLNIGDSYAGSGKGAWANKDAQKAVYVPDHADPQCKVDKVPAGLKPKDLMGIPWRVAFALQEDGWYLRQDIIWHKPNAMPESVRDRCTKAHEYIFLLSKSPRYYYDHESIKEPANLTGKGDANTFRGGAYVNNSTFINSVGGKRTVVGNRRTRRDSFRRAESKRGQAIPGQLYGTHRGDRLESAWDITTRNRRSVWTVATRGYKAAHFATYPQELVEPCILAGCPEGGVVLDPFTGSGTTAVAALCLGRRFVGCEINPEYIALAETRIATIKPYKSERLEPLPLLEVCNA